MKAFLERGWKVRVGHNGQVAVISARDKATAQAIFRRQVAKGLAAAVYRDGALQWESKQ